MLFPEVMLMFLLFLLIPNQNNVTWLKNKIKQASSIKCGSLQPSPSPQRQLSLTYPCGLVPFIYLNDMFVNFMY